VRTLFFCRCARLRRCYPG